MNLLEPYHYTECGLDNVYLYNIPIVQDHNGEETICIPKINLLHDTIAKALIMKKGLLNGDEIRFIRTHIGFKQAEFSELLGKEAQAVGRWERGETSTDKTTDILIRSLAIKYLGLDMSITYEDISRLSAAEAANDNIDIDGFKENYQIMVA